jgi:hypothetical protein
MSDYDFIMDMDLYSKNKKKSMISSYCEQLFNDIEKSIDFNIKHTQGDFSKNPNVKYNGTHGFILDWTKCSQYNNFTKKYQFDKIYIKYSLSELNYPYNKYYQINWNVNGNRELEIILDD